MPQPSQSVQRSQRVVPAAAGQSYQVTGHQPEEARLVAAARQAAATDAATARAADQDGGHGATDHLGRLLGTVPTVEQAKGILMGHYGIDADAAFRVLQRWSQTTNTKLSDIAARLCAAASDGRPGLQPFLADLDHRRITVGAPSTSRRTG